MMPRIGVPFRGPVGVQAFAGTVKTFVAPQTSLVKRSTLTFVHVAEAVHVEHAPHDRFVVAPARIFSLKPGRSHATSPSATTQARNPAGAFFAQTSAAHEGAHNVTASEVIFDGSGADSGVQLPPDGASGSNVTFEASVPLTGWQLALDAVTTPVWRQPSPTLKVIAP